MVESPDQPTIPGDTVLRFSKREILEMFRRQDIAYRLSILSSHWLHGGAQYNPSAINDAHNLQMQVTDRWVSFSDIAALLEDNVARFNAVSDFTSAQLHAFIRAPFELLQDYCEDYDKVTAGRSLMTRMRETEWYFFARIMRNAISHNLLLGFNDADRRRFPLMWRDIKLDESMEGKQVTDVLGHKPALRLFLDMLAFAEALPDHRETQQDPRNSCSGRVC
jgi:hypothetical protein